MEIKLYLEFFWAGLGRIQAKILRTHKNLPTSTPMA